MRMSEGVEWAVHACSLLGALPEGKALPARRLAEYFDLPEAYLAKTLQQLSAAGLVETRRGPGGGYRLARHPGAIRLLEIVDAVMGRGKVFQCAEIRRRGPCAAADGDYPRPCGIARTMWRAEKAWRDVLAGVTLAEIQRQGLEETPPLQIEKTLEWFGEALA